MVKDMLVFPEYSRHPVRPAVLRIWRSIAGRQFITETFTAHLKFHLPDLTSLPYLSLLGDISEDLNAQPRPCSENCDPKDF